jgi:hypothetical protein
MDSRDDASKVYVGGWAGGFLIVVFNVMRRLLSILLIAAMDVGAARADAAQSAAPCWRRPVPQVVHAGTLPRGICRRCTCAGSSAAASLGKAIRQNVIDNVAKLGSATPILSAVEVHKLKVVGGVYGLKDGKVDIVT